MAKFKSEHKIKLSSKDKRSKREHFFPPSVTAKAVPPPPSGGGCLSAKMPTLSFRGSKATEESERIAVVH